MTSIAAKLAAAYEKVKKFPEDSPTGWRDMIELRQVVGDAIPVLRALEQGRASEIETTSDLDDVADRIVKRMSALPKGASLEELRRIVIEELSTE